MARFVIQNNLISENDLKKLQSICKKNNIEYEIVTITPFTLSLPEFNIRSDNFYYGSTTFISNVYEYLMPKGIFFDPNKFLISNYLKHWKDHMLNSEATLTTLTNLINDPYDDCDEFFIRPNADDKSFEGQVMEFRKIKESGKRIYNNLTIQNL